MNQFSFGMEICDGMNAEARAIKRGCDVVFALLGLIILSPFFLVIYVRFFLRCRILEYNIRMLCCLVLPNCIHKGKRNISR